MRYAQASEGYESYGIEGTAYTKSSSLGEHFGLIRDDVDYPNPNPHTAMTTGGQGRSPYVQSADPIDREFDMTVNVIDENAPIECALGSRSETTETVDTTDINVATFTEADVLPTATIEHVQEDIELVEWFIGCKASLTISASSDEPVTFDFSWTAADYEFEETLGNESSPSPPEIDPYRFNMIGDITLNDPSDGSTVTTIATPNSVEFGWDNGNETRHHGKGREAYAVAETTAEEKYDMTMTVDVEDTELFARAAENKAPVDIEVVFDRNYDYPSDLSTLEDAIVVRLNDAVITDAPVPNASEGVVEADIAVQPTSTEIEIRSPTN